MFTYSLLFKGSVDFECLVLSVNSVTRNVSSPDFTVALFYRPPNSGHAPIDLLFSTFCNIFFLCSRNLYLVGDFNVDFLCKDSPLYRNLLSLLLLLISLKLYQNQHVLLVVQQPLLI